MATQLTPRPTPEPDLHEHDFYSWCLAQAALARAGRPGELDLVNLAAELEVLGGELANALRSSYRILLIHLLKWRYQPGRQSRGWVITVVRERGNAAERLAHNPGLAKHKRRLFAEAYARARKEAAAESGLPLAVFPGECPFTLEQAVDDDFWP